MNNGFIGQSIILDERFIVSDHFISIKQAIVSRLEQELDTRLGYHNTAHTLDVLKQAVEIAEEEGINDEKDLLLLKIAAVFHDSGFLLTYRGHEEKSCEIAIEALKNTFDDTDLKKICGMIMATKIPQSPKNLLEQIICDADLDYLGRDDFGPISDSLLKEFLSFKIIPENAAWDHIQIGFFETHRYFTNTANKKRNSKKMQHLQMLKERSNRLT